MTGELCVAGIGPGSEGYITADAQAALDAADLIVGYKVYINLLKDRYPGKEMYSTGMGDEVARCEYALDKAYEGRKVAVVCSGDPGVYGMASLILELDSRDREDRDGEVDITIIPGVTAALSGAAILGSPIGSDFAVISLSTALTPWEEIAVRLKAAAEGDFSIVLYNPVSRVRPDTLRQALDIIGAVTGRERVAGYVKNIGRDGEEHKITTLGGLYSEDLDMFTTVYIGNKDTKSIGGRMITGRKYIK